MLAQNMETLASNFPNFTPNELLQATAASINIGTDKKKGISGNPLKIDNGTAGGNYGSNILNLMDCFN